MNNELEIIRTIVSNVHKDDISWVAAVKTMPEERIYSLFRNFRIAEVIQFDDIKEGVFIDVKEKRINVRDL